MPVLHILDAKNVMNSLRGIFSLADDVALMTGMVAHSTSELLGGSKGLPELQPPSCVALFPHSFSSFAKIHYKRKVSVPFW